MQKEPKLPIIGGCLCRAVRYEFHAPPRSARICWCRLCQYLATGNGTVNVFFPADKLQVTGELGDFRSIADSGNIMHRRFCLTCGTQIFTAAEARPNMIAVRAGTLDDSSLVRPAATIWVSQAPAWARIDSSLPQFPQQPPS
jgi:hypothetical protein